MNINFICNKINDNLSFSELNKINYNIELNNRSFLLSNLKYIQDTKLRYLNFENDEYNKNSQKEIQKRTLSSNSIENNYDYTWKREYNTNYNKYNYKNIQRDPEFFTPKDSIRYIIENELNPHVNSVKNEIKNLQNEFLNSLGNIKYVTSAFDSFKEFKLN